MIKLYKIRIGEKVYEVEVEDVSEKEGTIETSASSDSKQEAGKNENPPLQKETEGKEIINKLWYFIFGYATLVCTSSSNEEKKNETNKVIEEKIIGMSKYFKMENFK